MRSDIEFIRDIRAHNSELESKFQSLLDVPRPSPTQDNRLWGLLDVPRPSATQDGLTPEERMVAQRQLLARAHAAVRNSPRARARRLD